MAVKKGLGKGLDSMIPTKTTMSGNKENRSNAEVLIKLSEIEPNKQQPRKVFNEDSLQELAESIKNYGIVQPLIVSKEKDYYKIIAGERRWRAAKIAGINEVPVIVKDYTEQEIMEIALIENIQREDLNPIEEAMAYQRLADTVYHYL